SRIKDARTALKPELGYRWEAPPDPAPYPYDPFWQLTETDLVASMVNEIVEIEWRVDHLRTQIEKLGGEPRGRTRRSLAEQLAVLFLDPTRLADALGRLSDEGRRYYTNLLLHLGVQGLYVAPKTKGLWSGFSRPWPELARSIAKAGLALQSEAGDLFVPYGTTALLPQLTIEFPRSPEPKHVVSAADPRRIVAQVQQLLGLLQTETFELRPQPRWEAPEYPYAEPVVCWPPTPADAERLQANVQRERTFELWPPVPPLTERALRRWADALATSEDWVELLYHVLVEAGILWQGSPLTVDTDLAHDWMALTPGRQVGVIYRLYRNISQWAAWWPLWREGTVRLRRTYHGYWSLNSIDESVALCCSNLRWILLELLSFLPHDTWLATADLYQWLDELFPTPDTHPYLMGLAPEQAKGGWSTFLHTALRCMLTGPLHALGLVDLGPSLENVTAVRLRGLQSLQWGKIAEIALDAAGQLAPEAVCYLADEQSLELKTPVPPDFMTFILRWAKPSGFSQSLVRYRLDVQRLHRTFEGGADPAALVEAWRTYVGFDPLPEIVEWWEQWWTRYGRVRLYPPQALLETRDAVTMQELQVSLPSLQASITGILTPKAAFLEEEDVDRILEDLARQGYMPKETS
ncbi:MAG: hypothetical protein ACP5HG_16315, partial [Anaerolineae bacterium]